ncbi:uncharacterized protein ASPGLDRAFT_33257 [Aspergillus glaucus CBS 516.65]|uniref:Uncharacterized protein n=1 Tax=Aspergillus glaucus CBS 516.65 TaxID=1160497 RepID=A0A1L9VR16_ASPGL|nr:hypothetical protein ASPGLDRAFT_33257 [Aspergillus glaucus CBS 516.65]OJJ86346.1 hypothetical protein ASPGLDRAFT_33257 [Aspergillus glaucus CBS 516.65]
MHREFARQGENMLPQGGDSVVRHHQCIQCIDTVPRVASGVGVLPKIFCVKHIFPDLCFSKGAIDYFLSHIVYSKELREFPDKLSASGWDISEINTPPPPDTSAAPPRRPWGITVIQVQIYH